MAYGASPALPRVRHETLGHLSRLILPRWQLQQTWLAANKPVGDCGEEELGGSDALTAECPPMASAPGLDAALPGRTRLLPKLPPRCGNGWQGTCTPSFHCNSQIIGCQNCCFHVDEQIIDDIIFSNILA